MPGTKFKKKTKKKNTKIDTHIDNKITPKRNKRTNGPVSAHLISGPSISTKHTKPGCIWSSDFGRVTNIILLVINFHFLVHKSLQKLVKNGPVVSEKSKI